MSRRYQQPIEVWINKEGMPIAFSWQGRTYAPLTIIGRWHLMDRWWADVATRDWSNREYYRVMREKPSLQFFELFQTAAGAWFLDTVLD